HGSDEQIESYVRPMIEGRFTGTMCLSEPEAGSNLADITTRAEPQDDGTYRLFGQKMWISGGEHSMAENIVHLVLAKVPGSPAGTRGISLFIVPKFLVGPDGSRGERNDIVITGLNHKMGFRGTVNTMPTLGQGLHTPGGRAGGRLPGGRGEHRPQEDVHHDERGPPRRGPGSDRARVHRLPQVPGLRPGPTAGSPGRAGPRGAAGPAHRPRGRAADAAGAEVLRRGRPGAGAVLREPGRPLHERARRRGRGGGRP